MSLLQYSLTQNGAGPSRPAKRAPHTATVVIVDPINTTVLRFAQSPRKCELERISSIQPLLRMKT